MSHSYAVGQRVSYDGVLCTIRYVGDVKGTKGEWLGVEWDNPARGKHSGEHQGVRYFKCLSKHPTAGSFVRPSRPSDTPLGFLQALHEKYASDLVRSKQAGVEIDEHGVESSIEISGKAVEEVGFEKIRKQLAALHELQIVILDGLSIQGLLPPGGGASRREDELRRITDTCPKVAEFDLSRNLIRRWGEIEDICSQLKFLRSLKLNGNRFDDITGTFQFEKTTELSLEETLLPWEDVADLTFRFPSLKSLSVSLNELSSISTPISTTVTTLTLENNHFESLSSVRCLAGLPNLTHLSLQGNRIHSAYSSRSEESEPLEFSPSLTDLDVSWNQISSWSFVNALPKVFPGLTSLRISNNPLYKGPLDSHGDVDSVRVPMTVDEAYMLTLSRLSSLQALNYTSISPQDRSNGELYYLSRIAKELSNSPPSEEKAILESHPRYQELCETHGAPVIKRAPSAETGGVNPRSLEAHLITFTFYMPPSPCTNSDSTEETIHKIEIPKSFDIYRVKAIVSRLFSLTPLRFKLMWETEDWDPVDETKVGEDEWDSEDEMVDGEEPVKAAPAVETGDGDKYVRREVELTDSTREVGFWFSNDVREAKLPLSSTSLSTRATAVTQAAAVAPAASVSQASASAKLLNRPHNVNGFPDAMTGVE
ncbi:hypothetical protein FQN54_005750 [Arachnomyces sp. PD_36]|nr:hypothetical protein FQN54_005750 [Arachnomyces sp. PD_36]